ncbi:MAG: amidohydrolase family protein [Eubacteriales bacterium]|jgi:predicted TIM-barrel fold metal-dependent hydrolase
MVIDGHAHACGEYLTPESILDNLDRAGASMVTLSPQILGDNGYPLMDVGKVFQLRDAMRPINLFLKALPAEALTPISLDAANQRVYELHCQLPAQVLQFYWVDPTQTGFLRKTQEKFEEYDFIGIKVHQCVHDFDVDGGQVELLARFAGEKRIPFFLHLFNMEQTEKLVKLAQRYPDTIFIVAHLICIEAFIEKELRLKNVFFDISPVPVVGEGRVLLAVKCFGADHILLGSDTPFGRHDLEANVRRIDEMKWLTAQEKRLILGENMMGILRWKQGGMKKHEPSPLPEKTLSEQLGQEWQHSPKNRETGPYNL